MSGAFYQVKAPAGLQDLPEVAYVGPRRVEGGKARLFHLLQRSQDQRLELPVGRFKAPAGWVPRHCLVEPWSGGAAGMRRLRELRELGLSIEQRAFEPPDGSGSATTLWRLVSARGPKGPASRNPVGPAAEASSPAKPPAPPADLKPLTGHSFSASYDQPTGASSALQITPGLEHLLAPPKALLWILASQGAEAASQGYREYLRTLFHQEILPDIVRRLAPRGAVLWSAEHPWAVDVLVEALEALGAERVKEAA